MRPPPARRQPCAYSRRGVWPGRGRLASDRLALAALFGRDRAKVPWVAGHRLTDAAVAAILDRTAAVLILLPAGA